MEKFKFRCFIRIYTFVKKKIYIYNLLWSLRLLRNLVVFLKKQELYLY